MINCKERVWERLATLTGGFAPRAPSRFAAACVEREHLLEYAVLLQLVIGEPVWGVLVVAALKKACERMTQEG